MRDRTQVLATLSALVAAVIAKSRAHMWTATMALLASLSLTLVGLGMPLAQAHDTKIDRSWGHGGVTASHRFVFACDDDTGDDDDVYVQYKMHTGTEGRMWDRPGAGCSQSSQTAALVYWYQLCRDTWPTDSCTAGRFT